MQRARKMQTQRVRPKFGSGEEKPQRFFEVSRKVRRVWQRLRKQQRMIPWNHSDTHWQSIKSTDETCLAQSSYILAEISSKTICSFSIQKKLRHHLISDVDLYALFRSAACLAQPQRGRAFRELRSALRSRDLRGDVCTHTLTHTRHPHTETSKRRRPRT